MTTWNCEKNNMGETSFGNENIKPKLKIDTKIGGGSFKSSIPRV